MYYAERGTEEGTVVRRRRIKNERRSRGVEDIRLLKGGNFPFEFIIKELVVPPPPSSQK